MPRALQRSGSNSLASLLRAEPPDDVVLDLKRTERDGRRRRRRRRRSCLRLPLGGAGGCRVCACDEMDSSAAAPLRRTPGNDDEDEDGAAVQCFAWKKGAAAAAHRPSGAGAGEAVEGPPHRRASVPADAPRGGAWAVPDAVAVPVRGRRRRRVGRRPAPAVHALDVAAHRWCRVRADGLKGRFLFSVAGVGDDLYVVGGRSGGSDASKVKTHKGVLVFSPLTGLWRKAAPMQTPRSRPVLGVFEMSASCSILHTRAEKNVRRGKSRFGGASAVYEDPHRLSLRRLRLKDMLNEDTDSTDLASYHHGKSAGQEGEEGQPRLAFVAVGGRGRWDEPLVSGEIYDPLVDKWVEIAGFPTDVGLACSGVVCGRMFYVYCESDTLVAYHLDKGSWVVIQTLPPPPRLRDYAPTLVCCASRLFMLCVSWCDRHGPVNRREKVVRKLFELDLSSLQWTEASGHPDAPMDPNAAFAVGQDRVYAVEMFRIFGKVLDFVTACRVSDTEQKWSRVGRENAATEADAMSCRLKSMAVLHL
ncbi:unnamed protein product [Miscanthus lutarioriparius]|uniref:Uncharacterized protein n=1 Tax=Miscanthus lutarioriparius TaxID=422564 RepID=A0A811N5I0_9POAL|nr:unnamed protein product [Miscanthus lutarioriparius]